MDSEKSDESANWGRVPAYTLLFELGKRTMRPGGMELTRHMLDGLGIGAGDRVVEFAPGMGATTRMVLERGPASYVAVERDRASQEAVQRSLLNGTEGRCVVGKAEASGLEEASASVVFGEAMLTMQTPGAKQRIVEEAYRLLEPGGRYGIHETCLVPEDVPEALKTEIEGALREVLRVGARPLTVAEWRGLLEEAGFSLESHEIVAMHLLEPRRMIQDEGLVGALRFVLRVLRSPAARRRLLAIRRVFKKYADHLDAVVFVAVKPE